MSSDNRQTGDHDREGAQPPNADRAGEFSACDKIKLLLTGFFYTLDIFTDAYAAYKYHADKERAHFVYTLSFMLISPFFTVISNLRDYWSQRNDETLTWRVWTFRILFTLLFPLSVYVRFYDYWTYGCRVAQAKRDSGNDQANNDENRRQTNVNLLKQEREIVNFIRLRESFLEAAPQLILHVYIAAEDGYTFLDPFQQVSIVFSLCSLALTLGSLRDFLRSLVVRESATATATPAPGAEQNQPLERDRDRESAASKRKDRETSLLGIGLLTVAHFLCIAFRCAVFSLNRLDVVGPIIACHFVFLLAYLKLKDDIRLNLSVLWTVPNENSFLQTIANVTILPLLVVISFFSFIHNEQCLGHGYYFLILLFEDVLIVVLNLNNEIRGYTILTWAVTFAISSVLFFAFYMSEPEINEWSDALLKKFTSCNKSSEEDAIESQPISRSESTNINGNQS